MSMLLEFQIRRGNLDIDRRPPPEGKIKGPAPCGAKPLTWLSFLGAGGRSDEALEGKSLDFSISFSTPATSNDLGNMHEQG
jgi:hypothetical protein